MQEKHQRAAISKRAKKQKAASVARRAMGRPPVAREVARSQRVATFVTEQEKASLEQLADETSQSLSAVCHRLIAEGLERGKRTKPN